MKQATVIGAGGQMGQWFVKYFSDQGFQVTGYDSENKVSGKIVIISESLEE
jgi:prephenate dehydrogenase